MGRRTPMRDFDADSPQFRRPTESLPIIGRCVEPELIFVLQNLPVIFSPLISVCRLTRVRL